MRGGIHDWTQRAAARFALPNWSMSLRMTEPIVDELLIEYLIRLYIMPDTRSASLEHILEDSPRFKHKIGTSVFVFVDACGTKSGLLFISDRHCVLLNELQIARIKREKSTSQKGDGV